MADVYEGRLPVAKEHTCAVSDRPIAPNPQGHAHLRVGPVLGIQDRLVEEKNNSEPVPLGGMRSRGVNQGGVVLNESVVPGFVQRHAGVNVGR